jgi:oligopeptide transport system permease protein
LVLGLVVLVTVITVVFNLLVDLTYAFLDPKIRY